MPKYYKKILFLLIVAFVVVFGVSFFQSARATTFNQQINYQGKLTSNNPNGAAVPDGNYNFKFYLCTTGSDCSGSPVWSETYCASGCDGSRVAVTSGLFSIMLGQYNTTLASVNFNQTLYLEVKVGGSSATPAPGDWETLSPSKSLGAVPAAMQSAQLEGATWEAPGTIGSGTANSGLFTTLGASSAFTTSNGSVLSSAAGVLTLGGSGGTNHENLTLDFESVANQVGINSGTGVTALNFNALNLTTTGTGTFGYFKLGSSTTSGYVLTADASGNGTWQAATTGAQYSFGANNFSGTGNFTTTGTVTTTALALSQGVDRYIKMADIPVGDTSSTSNDLYIKGGSLLDSGDWNNGGNLYLQGGDTNAGYGGNVHLSGGQGYSGNGQITLDSNMATNNGLAGINLYSGEVFGSTVTSSGNMSAVNFIGALQGPAITDYVAPRLDMTGIVAYYPLNGNYYDYSGNAYNITSNYNASYVSGLVGKCVLFNGTNSYLGVSGTWLKLTTGGSFIAIIYPTSLGGGSAGRIIDISSSTNGQNGFAFYVGGTNQLEFVINNGTTISSSNNAITLNAWNVVAVTFDASGNAILYVNGVNVGSGTTGAASGITYSGARIGNRSGGTDRAFAGKIDEFLIFNSVKTATDINQYSQSIMPLGSIPINFGSNVVTAPYFQISTAPTANSTGADTIFDRTATPATNAGWLPIKKSDGTTVYIPYWA